jgi:thiol peroxidase
METKFNGMSVMLEGNILMAGDRMPDFRLTKTDLTEFDSKEHRGKWLVLNIFPSLDTSVCAMSVRKFNEQAAKLKNTLVLCISRDLPFAMNRFCATAGIKTAIPLSDFHYNSTFGKDLGVMQTSGPLNGLLARAVYVVSPEGKIVYSELVPEITQEPDYKSALAALKKQS